MVRKIETGLEDCFILEPDRFGDDRGYFSPYFIQKDLNELGIKFERVVQANRSKSSKGVVRGLHFQKEYPQSKLVRAIRGEVYDVAVDLRKDSPTYGKYYAVLLSEVIILQYFIPSAFAHGFLVTSDESVFV